MYRKWNSFNLNKTMFSMLLLGIYLSKEMIPREAKTNFDLVIKPFPGRNCE